MEKFIVKHHKLIVVLAFVLIIPALIGFYNTRVNYDMLNYLPDSMDTVKGQDELLKDFGKGAFSMVITDGLSDSQIGELETAVKNVDHVDTVMSLGTLENAGLPAQIIPDDLYDTFRNGNESIMAVFFDTSTSADETIAASTLLITPSPSASPFTGSGWVIVMLTTLLARRLPGTKPISSLEMP